MQSKENRDQATELPPGSFRTVRLNVTHQYSDYGPTLPNFLYPEYLLEFNESLLDYCVHVGLLLWKRITLDGQYLWVILMLKIGGKVG